jgi:tripartite-type tricarboxylate transporter receptor subunit TctC
MTLLERLWRAVARLVATAMLAALAASGSAYAQTWPTKTVRIVVPFAVGGTTDLLARVLGQALSEATGQPFVVDNKTGGGGTIGSSEVARAAPDGHTLLLTTTSTHSIAPVVGKLPYDTIADFTPIVHLVDSDTVVLGSPTLGVRTMAELIALARSKPGTINYTSSGAGTFGHLAFEHLAGLAGIDINHVPYRGSASALADLTAGRVHLTIDATATGLPHVRAGRAIGLGLTGPNATVPDIRPVGETVPGFAILIWFGILGPGGMNPELTQQINAVFNKAMQSSQMAERFKTFALEPRLTTPAEFAASIVKDRALFQSIATQRNVKVE